jgi:hypothetical protein
MDADVAFSASSPPAGGIGEALAKAGFTREFFGEDTPPVTHYALNAGEVPFYAEFLVPLTGSGQRRSGERDVTMSTAGVTAQKLRHLDLLLMQPWVIQLHGETSIPLASEAQVQIANPVGFIAQKLLIRDQRVPRKQAQDVLYIHDTLELFGSGLDELRMMWDEQFLPALRPKRAADIRRLWQGQYGTVDDVLRNAARLQPERDLEPARMQQACAYGLERVFGT